MSTNEVRLQFDKSINSRDFILSLESTYGEEHTVSATRPTLSRNQPHFTELKVSGSLRERVRGMGVTSGHTCGMLHKRPLFSSSRTKLFF